MTRIDFYILSENARSNRFQLACKLTDKAYQAGHRVCIYFSSDKELDHVDELLWTFSEQSFIPHDRPQQHKNSETPVLLTTSLENTEEHDILINLTDEIPSCFSQFERLLEPVDPNEKNRMASRERYRYYRDCGYSINNHEISV